MPSLQIRNLPNHVYEALARRAQRQRRSLAQQAVAELSRIPEAERRLRRIEVIENLRKQLRRQSRRKLSVSPARLVREDRNR